jgi:hypothetical protein
MTADNSHTAHFSVLAMQTPMTLTFRHIDHSETLENRARKLGARLERYCERIARCHVTLEGPGSCTSAAAPYLVKIDLIVPGAQIHADSLQIDGMGHKDIDLALHDAFDNARRQLQRLHPDRCGSAGRIIPMNDGENRHFTRGYFRV